MPLCQLLIPITPKRLIQLIPKESFFNTVLTKLLLELSPSLLCGLSLINGLKLHYSSLYHFSMTLVSSLLSKFLGSLPHSKWLKLGLLPPLWELHPSGLGGTTPAITPNGNTNSCSVLVSSGDLTLNLLEFSSKSTTPILLEYLNEYKTAFNKLKFVNHMLFFPFTFVTLIHFSFFP